MPACSPAPMRPRVMKALLAHPAGTSLREAPSGYAVIVRKDSTRLIRTPFALIAALLLGRPGARIAELCPLLSSGPCLHRYPPRYHRCLRQPRQRTVRLFRTKTWRKMGGRRWRRAWLRLVFVLFGFLSFRLDGLGENHRFRLTQALAGFFRCGGLGIFCIDAPQERFGLRDFV